MSTSNDELLRELQEQRRLLEELHARPSIGHLISKLIDRFAHPQMLLSSAVLLAVIGLVAGKTVPMTLKGLGFEFSTAAETSNERLAEKALKSHRSDSNVDIDTEPKPTPEADEDTH